jgi:hypothetical protein
MQQTRKMLFAAGFVCALLATAQALGGDDADDDTDDRVEAFFGGDYFGSGASAASTTPVEGDAFIAGGEVALNHPVAGDAALAGGSVHVAARVGADLYAAGGDVMVNAAVGNNARLAGGRVHATRHAAIGGRMSAAGSRVRIDGRVGETLAVSGDSVFIDGEIGGAVAVIARRLEIGPNARIGGQLRYRTRHAAQISPQAVIAGGVQESSLIFPETGLEPFARVAVWAGLAMFTAGLFVVGLLVLLLAPRASASLVSGFRSRPVASLLLGFAVLVCVPVAAVLAILSVIGIPLGMVLLFIWPVIVILGYLAGVIICVDVLAARLSRGKTAGQMMRVLGMAVVLVVLVLLSRVFVIGPLLILLILFAGTGAIGLATREALR